MGAVRWNTIAFHRSIRGVWWSGSLETWQSGGKQDNNLSRVADIEFANMKLDRTFESHKHVYNIKYTIDS